MEKVKLPKHVAEALDVLIPKYRHKAHLVHETVRGNSTSEEWETIRRYFRKDDGNTSDDLLRALVIGYEIERTPKERLRDYYEYLRQSRRRSIQDQQADAIKEALEILGITVAGIND